MAIKRINPSRNAYDNQKRQSYGYCIRVPKLPDAHQFVVGFVVFNDADNCFYKCVNVVTEDGQDYYTWRRVTFGATRAFLIPVGKLTEIDKYFITIEDTEKATVECIPKTLNELVFGLRRYNVELEPVGFTRTTDATYQASKTYYGFKWNDTIAGLTLEQRKAFSGEMKVLLVGTEEAHKTTGMYVLTEDTTFQPRTVYYIKSGSTYVAATVIVGQTVPASTYYNLKKADYIVGDATEAGFTYEMGTGYPVAWDDTTKLTMAEKMNEIAEVLNEHDADIPILPVDSAASTTLYRMCEVLNLIIDEVNPFSIPWQLLLNRMNKLEVQVGPADMQEVSDTLLNTRINIAEWADAQWQFLYFLSKDTSCVSGKTYYTRSASGGTIGTQYTYTAVASPSGSPKDKLYYEKMTIDTALLYGTMCQVDDSTLELIRWYDSKVGNFFDLLVNNDGEDEGLTLVDWLKLLEARVTALEDKVQVNTEGIRQLRLAIGHVGYITATGTAFQSGIEYFFWNDTDYYFETIDDAIINETYDTWRQRKKEETGDESWLRKDIYTFVGGKTAANLITHNAVKIANNRRELDELLGMELRKIYLETFATEAAPGTKYFYFDPYAGNYTFARIETTDAKFLEGIVYYRKDAGGNYHRLTALTDQTKYKLTHDNKFVSGTVYYKRTGAEGAYSFELLKAGTAAEVKAGVADYVVGDFIKSYTCYVIRVDEDEYLVGDDCWVYDRTTHTTAATGVTYYQYDPVNETYSAVEVSTDDNPNLLGYYTRNSVYIQSETNPKFIELTKKVTADVQFQSGKTYYAVVQNATTGRFTFEALVNDETSSTWPSDSYKYKIGNNVADKSYVVFASDTENITGQNLDVYRTVLGPILVYSTTDEAVDQIRENNEQIAHLKQDVWKKYNSNKEAIEDVATRANRLKELTGVSGDTDDVTDWNVDGYKLLTSGAFEEYQRYYTMEDKGKDVLHLYHELVSGTSGEVAAGEADYVIPYFAYTTDEILGEDDPDKVYYLYNSVTGVYRVATKATHPREVEVSLEKDYYVPGYYTTDDLTYQEGKTYYVTDDGETYEEDPSYSPGATIIQGSAVTDKVYEYNEMAPAENTFYEKMDPTPITEDFEPQTVDGTGVYIRKAHKEDGGYEEHNTHRGMIDRNTADIHVGRQQCGAFEKWTKRQLKAIEDFVLAMLLSTLEVITQERSTLSLLHQTVGKLIVIHNALERLDADGQTYKPADGVYDSGYTYYKAVAFALTEDTTYRHGKRYFVKKTSGVTVKYVKLSSFIDDRSMFNKTAHTTVQSGVTYYEYDEETETYTKVESPTGNPSAQGWYVKDEIYEPSDFEVMEVGTDYEIGLEASQYAYTKDLVIATTENYTINEIRLAVNRILNYHILSKEVPDYTELPDDTIILETMTYWRYVDDDWEKIVPEEADPSMIGQRVKDYDPAHMWYLKTSDDIPSDNYTETPCRIYLNELVKLHRRDSSLASAFSLMANMTGGFSSAGQFINGSLAGLV